MNMTPEPAQQSRSAQIRSGEYVRNWRLGFIRPMLWSALVFGLFALVTGILAAQNMITTLIFVVGYLFVVAITVFPFPYEVRVLVFLAGIFGVGVNELLFYGILSDATLFFYATVAIATLMLSPRAGWYAIGLALFTIATTGAALMSGLAAPLGLQIGSAKLEDWLSTSAMILIFSAIIILGLQKLQTEIELGQAQTNRALEELEADRNTLEERIQIRTADLETASRNSERRARQFEAITQVARTIASIQDLDTLLPRITHMISQHFGYYHTGIFMLDDAREYAVLKAANTEGGQKMLTRGHRLKVGQTGIVGYVAGTGNPRVALDAGEDVVFFNNPDLPSTRSEMALPLRIGRELIGVLDVQSEVTNAFHQEDVDALTTLADQVSIAIQNAGSFREARTLLAEAQTTTSNYVTQAWKILRPASAGPGYQTSGSVIKPLEKPLEGEHIQQAMKTNKTVAQSNSLTVPIRLRGQVIGVINLQVPQSHTWNVDDVDIAEAVAERLSLAIETSTLLKATQHRADIERITTEISGKLSESNRMEVIIQTAAEELSRVLGGSDVIVQIEPIQSEKRTRDASKGLR
jgi:GAF domain-containing protein